MVKRNAVRSVGITLVLVIAGLLAFGSAPAAAIDLVGQTSANLGWTPSSGSVAGYGVFVSRNGGAYPTTANFTVTSPSGTVSGAYGDTLLVKVAAFDASGAYGPFSPASDPLHFVQTPPPGIGLSVASLTPSAVQGQSPASQSFTVRNSGSGTLSYSISDDQTWLSVSPASGTSTGELDSLTVSYATTALTAGSYNATITVSGGAGVTAQAIAVTLALSAPATPAMTLGATSLSASTQQGQSPASQTFTVRNSGSGGTLSYAFSESASWLSVTPASGTSTGEFDSITVAFATTGLAAGSYNATITASASGLASQTLTVSLSVTAPPTPAMTLSASTLSASVSQGNNAANRSFTIQNTGSGGNLSYALTEGASWLTLSPASGTSTGEVDTITVSFSTASLAAGSYSAPITVSASGLPSQTVNVTLSVTSGSPLAEVSLTSISATTQQGTNAPNVVFTVRNAGGGTLSYTVADQVTWLSVSPTSGTSIGEADTLTVSFQSASRGLGTHNTTISIFPSGAAAVNIPVTLVVTAAPPAALEVSTTALSASAALGASPAGQTFSVRNSGAGTLSYAVSENQSWLSVTPTSGSSSGEADTINVSFATAGLASGTYTATITISATGLPSETVGVSLTITASAALTLSATSLAASATQGQNAGAQSFTVRNSGAGSLAWSASESASWLSIGPASGTSTGEADSVTVSFPSSGLAVGTYTGTITVAGTGVASKTVSVMLAITSAAPPPPPSQPVLSLSTTSLVLTAAAGRPAAPASFSVRNSGVGSLAWSASDNTGWLSLAPASGTSTGESDNVSVSVSTAGLLVGSYSGTITVSGTGVTSKTVSATLQVIASGERFDFDGDGAPELLWHRATDSGVQMWDLSAAGVTGTSAAPTSTTGWTIVAVDDFDGDGHDDLLWRTTTTGQYTLWRMNGASRLSTANLQAPTGYEPIVAGDFDGDHKADLLWLNAAHDDLKLTLLAGGTNVAAAAGTAWPLSGGWVPVGAADCDADGDDDLAWRAGDGSIAVWLMAGATVTRADLISTLDGSWFLAGAQDVNGDGMADLLLRNRNAGDLAVWYLQGSTYIGGEFLSQNVDPLLELAAIGDFDRDGHADLVWRHSRTGVNTLWRVPSASAIATVPLTTVSDLDWVIVNPWSLAAPAPPQPTTSGDLDGNGAAEAIWTHGTSGAVRAWQVSPSGGVTSLALPSASAGWTAIAIDDFDGDTKSDVLWKTSLGTYQLWRMDGATRLSTSTMTQPAGYRFETTCDCDGDGKADVLWRNDDSQQVRLTLLQGGTNAATAPSASWPAPPAWRVLGPADFDGDGRDDLVWREDIGTIAIWMMNGTSILKGVVLGVVPAEWLIVGSGDIDADGKADLVWRNVATGANAIWLMTGPAYGDGYYLPTWTGTQNVVAAVGDFDGDGRADMLWRHQGTGVNTLWTDVDRTGVRTLALPTDADQGWQLRTNW